MSKLEINLNNATVSKEEIEFLESVIKLVISKRPDQLRHIVNDYLNAAPVNRINLIHDSLYKNYTADESIVSNKTIWDSSIINLNNQKSWVTNLFLEVISSADLTAISSLNLNKDSRIASLGSCFATNISKHFRKLGYNNTYTLRVEEAVNSPRLINMYLNPDEVPANARDQWDARFGIESKQILELIPDLDIIILTFGVGFDLVDENGKLVLDTTNVSKKIQEGTYNFVNPSIEEQSKSISSCINKIKSINSRAPVFVTISPVPLSGFVGDIHVFRANTLSKANLAISIKNARELTDFIYVPTYEVVTSIAPILYSESVWGEDGTSRHPKNKLIEEICTAFINLFNHYKPKA